MDSIKDGRKDGRKDHGFLYVIEKVGNKIPHTMSLFLGMVVIVIIASFLVSLADVSAIDPMTGEKIEVVNLLSTEGLVFMLTHIVSNFAAFPILGVTLVVGVAMGLCEVGGFFNAFVRFCFLNVKSTYIALFVSFIGIFMCSFDGAVSMVIVPTLAASIYYSIGKNPLIGVFSGFAAAATGAAMEFVPGFWQVSLTPLTNTYAQMVDPNFYMPLMSDYFMILPASILAVLTNTFITMKIITPRFSDYKLDVETVDENISDKLTETEIKAVKSAGLGTLIYLVILLVCCIPHNSFFRSETGSLIVDAPLMSSIENLLFLLFIIPGFIYARKTGQIKSVGDLAELLANGLKSLLSFIVLAMVISQFISLFNYSNLARIIGINGGTALSNLNVNPLIAILVIYLSYSALDLIIISGSSKYLMFGSIVVPVLMQMNINPAFTQAVLRCADGSTNQMTPLNYFFPVVLSLCSRYDKKCGIGTAMSSLIPYGLANVVTFGILIVIFYFFELPIGVNGGTVWLH